MEEYNKLVDEYKITQKQYEQAVKEMYKQIQHIPFLVERNGKTYVNKESKDKYWEYKSKYVLPLEDKLFELEKKRMP